LPDFEPRSVSVPAFIPPARSSSNRDHEFDRLTSDGEEQLRPQREGLPPGYRMRTEPHYVEQLTARASAGQVRPVPISQIECGRPIDGEDLAALVRSITAHGVLQPLIVRTREGGFQLIAGARRLAAASRAGLSHVPCLVHACDDAHLSALEEATNVRGVATPEPAAVPGPPVAGLEDIAQSLSTIESCMHLLDDRRTVLRDRVALDLIRSEAHGAAVVVRCLHAFTRDAPLALADEPLAPLVREVIEGFDAECRLCGASIAFDKNDHVHVVPVDRECFETAMAGALGGLLALVRNSRTPAIRVRLIPASARGPLTIELSQQCAPVRGEMLTGFFDVHWTDRPGGYKAAAGFAAARHAIELHGGTVAVQTSDRGGCRILMTVPSPHLPR
jgi:hypothetical protein